MTGSSLLWRALIVAGAGLAATLSGGQLWATREMAAPAAAPEPCATKPTLAFSTYLGGRHDDGLREISRDSEGNIVIVGHPIDAGAFPAARRFGPPGDHDVYVAKLTPDARRLLWITVIGGSRKDRGYGIALDPRNDIYVAGRTSSPDFPTTPGAWDRTYRGGTNPLRHPHGPSDAFVLKLAADGSSLVYSTYLGGSGEDAARGGLAVDREGSAYVVGTTGSRDFLVGKRPANSPHVNQFLGGSMDAFLTKVSPDGSRIVYSRFLGSSDDSGEPEGAFGVGVDAAGNAYVHATVGGSDAATTPGAYARASRGSPETYAVKVSPDGGRLVYATHLGGSGAEFAEHRLALDRTGSVYLVGQTRSRDFPTIKPSQGWGGGPADAYLVKLDAGGHPEFSTLIGGSGDETALGPAVDEHGNVHVTGQTSSHDFPVTADAFAPKLRGRTDAYLQIYAPTGRLLYSTYFGGSSNEFARFVTTDSRGNPIIGGTTSSSDLPVTAGVVQPVYSGGTDIFLAKFEVVGRLAGCRGGTGGVPEDRGAPRLRRGVTSAGGLGGPFEAPHVMDGR